MADDRLPSSVQESLATAIALIDDNNSSVIANMVEADLFDSPLDEIVSRCQEHRRSLKKPPGKSHIDDVFASVLEDKDHKQNARYHSIVTAMVRHVDSINTEFLLGEVSAFVRRRRYRTGLMQAVERYQKGGDDVFEDIDSITRRMAHADYSQRDYGFSMADGRALGFLDRDSNDYCSIGIKELDRVGVVPARQEYLAFLSPPNRGKSQFLTHCGKYALLKGWRVLHYTLENSDTMTAQRYFQTLFSGVRHEGSYHYTSFEDDDGNIGLRTEVLKPNFVIDERDRTYEFLRRQTKEWAPRLENLRIRRFASGRLTFEMLEKDLDELKIVRGFEPDMILLDMPQLMKMPHRDKDYTSQDELVTSLRGLAVDRNLAMVAPQQGNRSSAPARNVQAQHGAGTFGVFGIADNMITYSQTPSEEQHGLARLYTQKVRNDRARMTVCVTQHYDSGQFCMDSCLMTSRLRDQIKDYVGYKSGEASEEDDEFEQPKTTARK